MIELSYLVRIDMGLMRYYDELLMVRLGFGCFLFDITSFRLWLSLIPKFFASLLVRFFGRRLWDV